MGQVPVLRTDDGELLTENPAVLQYVADRYPRSGLAPQGGFERYGLQQWLNFITSELHKQFTPLFAADTPAEYGDVAKQKIRRRFDWLEGELRGKDYLLGKQFTVADGYLYAVASWSKFVGIDLGKWPELAVYLQRVAARPKVRQALIAEGLVRESAAQAVS